MARSAQGPHREDIKAMIRKRGLALTELAIQLGYRRTSVHVALTKPWPRLQAKIAEFLGTTTHELWPQWYAPDGTCTVGRRRNANRRAGSRNVYPSKVA